MIHSSERNGSEPEVESVLGVLSDPDCRRILGTLGEPRTAPSIVDACDIPRSTVYRKLDRMVEVGLVTESIRIDTHGRNTSRYRVDVSDVNVRLTEGGTLSVSVSAPSSRGDSTSQ